MGAKPPPAFRLPEAQLSALPTLRLRAWQGLLLAALIIFPAWLADAQGTVPGRPGVIATLARWTPLLLRGFGFNILISFFAMAIGTVLGAFLGIGLISLGPARYGNSVGCSPSSSATRPGSCCCSSRCSCCRSSSASAAW